MLKKIVVLGVAAIALGCASSQAQPQVPDYGVTEQQPMHSGAPANTAQQPSREHAHRPAFQTNVLRAAHDNDDYRRVLFTGDRTQLALMTIPPGSDIGMEMHPKVEQLIFIASGQGKAITDGHESPIVAGDVLIATPGTTHNVVNIGFEPLRIYTIYAPANHIDGRVQHTKSDAEADRRDQAFGQGVH